MVRWSSNDRQVRVRVSRGAADPSFRACITWTSGERKQLLTSDYVVIICPGIVGIMRLMHYWHLKANPSWRIIIKVCNTAVVADLFI